MVRQEGISRKREREREGRRSKTDLDGLFWRRQCRVAGPEEEPLFADLLGQIDLFRRSTALEA